MNEKRFGMCVYIKAILKECRICIKSEYQIAIESAFIKRGGVLG